MAEKGEDLADLGIGIEGLGEKEEDLADLGIGVEGLEEKEEDLADLGIGIDGLEDKTEEDAKKEKHTAAATQIQASVRGQQTRKGIKEQKAAKEAPKGSAKDAVAASEGTAKDKNEAALKIQSLQRAQKNRDEVGRMKTDKAAKTGTAPAGTTDAAAEEKAAKEAAATEDDAGKGAADPKAAKEATAPKTATETAAPQATKKDAADPKAAEKADAPKTATETAAPKATDKDAADPKAAKEAEAKQAAPETAAPKAATASAADSKTAPKDSNEAALKIQSLQRAKKNKDEAEQMKADKAAKTGTAPAVTTDAAPKAEAAAPTAATSVAPKAAEKADAPKTATETATPKATDKDAADPKAAKEAEAKQAAPEAAVLEAATESAADSKTAPKDQNGAALKIQSLQRAKKKKGEVEQMKADKAAKTGTAPAGTTDAAPKAEATAPTAATSVDPKAASAKEHAAQEKTAKEAAPKEAAAKQPATQEKQTAAATQIQASVRGQQTRKGINKQKAAKDTLEREREFLKEALKGSEKDTAKERSEAALKIQSVQRAKKTKDEVEQMKTDKAAKTGTAPAGTTDAAPKAEAAAPTAATSVAPKAASAKEHAAQEKTAKEAAAATQIQASVRGQQTRKGINEQKAAKEAPKGFAKDTAKDVDAHPGEAAQNEQEEDGLVIMGDISSLGAAIGSDFNDLKELHDSTVGGSGWTKVRRVVTGLRATRRFKLHSKSTSAQTTANTKPPAKKVNTKAQEHRAAEDQNALQASTTSASVSRMRQGRAGAQSSVELLEETDLVKRLCSRIRAASYTTGGEDWAKLFREQDKDRSGEISWEEFYSMCRRVLKISDKESHLRLVFRSLDPDGSGQVSIDELVLLVKDPIDRMRSHLRQAVFARYANDWPRFMQEQDPDGSGSMSWTEFRVMCRQCLKLIDNDVQLNLVFRTIDSDASGELSLTELVQFAQEGAEEEEQKAAEWQARKDQLDEQSQQVRKTIMMKARKTHKAEQPAEKKKPEPPAQAGKGDDAVARRVQTLTSMRGVTETVGKMCSRLKSAAYIIGGKDWDKLFHTADRDRSGEICWSEFYSMCRRILRLTDAEKQLRAVFRLVDKDGGGTVSIDELVQVVAWQDENRNNKRNDDKPDAQNKDCFQRLYDQGLEHERHRHASECNVECAIKKAIKLANIRAKQQVHECSTRLYKAGVEKVSNRRNADRNGLKDGADRFQAEFMNEGALSSAERLHRHAEDRAKKMKELAAKIDAEEAQRIAEAAKWKKITPGSEKVLKQSNNYRDLVERSTETAEKNRQMARAERERKAKEKLDGLKALVRSGTVDDECPEHLVDLHSEHQNKLVRRENLYKEAAEREAEEQMEKQEALRQRLRERGRYNMQHHPDDWYKHQMRRLRDFQDRMDNSRKEKDNAELRWIYEQHAQAAGRAWGYSTGSELEEVFRSKMAQPKHRRLDISPRFTPSPRASSDPPLDVEARRRAASIFFGMCDEPEYVEQPAKPGPFDGTAWAAMAKEKGFSPPLRASSADDIIASYGAEDEGERSPGVLSFDDFFASMGSVSPPQIPSPTGASFSGRANEYSLGSSGSTVASPTGRRLTNAGSSAQVWHRQSQGHCEGTPSVHRRGRSPPRPSRRVLPSHQKTSEISPPAEDEALFKVAFAPVMIPDKTRYHRTFTQLESVSTMYG